MTEKPQCRFCNDTGLVESGDFIGCCPTFETCDCQLEPKPVLYSTECRADRSDISGTDDRTKESCAQRFDGQPISNFRPVGEPITENFVATSTVPMPAPLEGKAPLKMYCIFSPSALKAMKGIRGKLAAQAGHAYLHAWWDALLRHDETAKAYSDSQHAYKVTLGAPAEADEAWFDNLIDHYKPICGVTKVVDAGFTVFDGPTLTCIGIGPISPDDREEILAGLRPLT